MKTAGICAIDVLIDDLANAKQEYVDIFGFENCGADGSGHMTKVGEFHIYFRLGGGSSVVRSRI